MTGYSHATVHLPLLPCIFEGFFCSGLQGNGESLSTSVNIFIEELFPPLPPTLPGIKKKKIPQEIALQGFLYSMLLKKKN